MQTGLTSLADAVAALQTSLASAATADEVAALSTSLAAVQADLDDLLAQNNIYAPTGGTLTIDSQSSLDFATALGDKVSIINGSVSITQSSSMSASELTTVMGKMISITGDASFTAKATGVTPADGFSALTGVATMTLDVNGDVSLPELASATKVKVLDNTKLTSFSAPKLATVTTIGGTTDHHLSFAKATSVNLASLVRYTEGLKITQKSGSVDLSAFANTPATGTTEITSSLELDGAETLTAPLRTAGKIIADDLTAVDLPLWKGDETDLSSFDSAKSIKLPSITGDVDITLADWAPKAETVHVVGTAKQTSSTAYSYPSFTGTSANVTSIKLEGVFEFAKVVSAADLTSFTITGNARDVQVSATDISELVLGHTSKVGTYNSGSLKVTGNLNLTSLTASDLDDISSLDISGNTDLTTLSFPKLNSLGTTAAGVALTAANVYVTDNDLSASNIQLPSDSTDVTNVTPSITSNSGLSDLEAYIVAASALDTNELVTIDNVAKVTLKDGTTPSSVALITSTTSASKGFSWGGEDESVDIVKAVADSGTRVNARYQTATTGLNTAKFTNGTSNTTALGTSDVISLSPRGTSIASLTTASDFTNTISGFNANNPSTYAQAIEDELNRQLDAGGHPYSVDIVNDFGENYTYNVEATDVDAGTATTISATTLVDQVLKFSFGTTNLTAIITQTGDAGVEAGVVHAINNGSLSKTYRAEVSSSKVKVTPLTNQGSDDNLFANNSSAPGLTWADYSATSSTSYGIKLSQVINTTERKLNRGWRITMLNESLTVKADELEPGMQNAFAGGTLTSTTISNIETSDVGTALSNTSVLVAWDNIQAGSVGTFVAGSTHSFATWL